MRLRNSAASAEVKRRSAARSSVNWPRAEPSQRQRRILAGGDDQVHPRRQVLKQKGHGTVNRFGIKNVVVVKDEDEAVREGGELVDQGRQQRFGWRRLRLRSMERSQHPCSNILHNRLQSRDEVGQKACEVVIPFLQRQPGHPNLWFASLAIRDPFADQRGFPKAGRCGDESKFAARTETIVHPCNQPGAEDSSGPRRGDIKFRGQDGRGHGSIINQPPRDSNRKCRIMPLQRMQFRASRPV